jgi:hypothetical protein
MLVGQRVVDIPDIMSVAIALLSNARIMILGQIADDTLSQFVELV